jgi:inhibitor of cysteine peptidase
MFPLTSGYAAGRQKNAGPRKSKAKRMQTLTINKADKGKTLEASVDTTVELRLPENPTTGYRWKADDLDGSVLVQKEARFEVGSPAIGEGGTRIFRYQAVAPGSASLRLKLFREWEGDSSILERFEVVVLVKK